MPRSNSHHNGGADRLRAMDTAELSDLCVRLRQTVQGLSESTTPLGRGLKAHFMSLLTEATAERQRRGHA